MGSNFMLAQIAGLPTMQRKVGVCLTRISKSMLKTEDGRKVLTFPRRLRILLGVAQGLNFVHTGIQFDLNRPYMEKDTALHRDVKSTNICITSTFGAKLTDSGLGKLVAKDSEVLESIARIFRLSTGGVVPLGTPARL